MAFFVFPDTLHKPLEEVAALFGDRELVVVYQQELEGAGPGKATLDEIENSIPMYDSRSNMLKGRKPDTALRENAGALFI